MKWNGIVSQSGQAAIAPTFASANASQASSIALGRAEPVARMTDSLDGGLLAQLLTQPPDADLDDVRPRVEVVAPDIGEEALAADGLTCVLDQVVEQVKLPVGEIGHEIPQPRLTPGEVEGQGARVDDALLFDVTPVSQLDAHPGHELVEREGFRQVVARPEPEAA